MAQAQSATARLQLPSALPCPVARRDCVTCHMPKIEIPEAHAEFSDHWIRIAKPGAPYPE
jgi:hypothetical protein